MNRLLLTSAGITNQRLADALAQLTGKPAHETTVGFIPTAASAQVGNKDWFFAQIDSLRKYGWTWIDVVDIVSPSIDWRARLDAVDIIFVSGGNTFYLLDAVRRSGFDSWLENEGSNKVYVGASAGSIIMTPRIDVATIPPADDNFLGLEDLAGLNMIDAEIEPHCAGDRYVVVEKWAAKNRRHIFAIDDQCAITVTKTGKIQPVGLGIIHEYKYK